MLVPVIDIKMDKGAGKHVPSDYACQLSAKITNLITTLDLFSGAGMMW